MLESVALGRRGQPPVTSDEAVRRLSRRAAELAEGGKHAAAALVWEELAQIEPDHEQITAGLGAALLAASQDRKAAHVLGRATRLHPRNPMLLRLHAQALTRNGEHASAIGALYMALSLDPASTAIQSCLGKALHDHRQPQAALPHASKAFDAEPSISNAALLTGILIDLDYSEAALAVVDSVAAEGQALASKLVLRALLLAIA